MKLAIAALLLMECACVSTSTVRQEVRHSVAFQEVASPTGLVFAHQNGAKGEFWLPEIMGSGVALFDYDSDGDLDVYLVQGTPDGGGNRLFRNELIPTGRLHFSDVTAAAGVGYSGWGMGVATADIDGDGDLDLLVTNYGTNVLYRNEGNGRFTDISREAGIQSEGWHTSATFFDYDRDGRADLFICRYVDFSPSMNKRCRGNTGALDYCTPKAYRPVPDRLFHNEGRGRFLDVSLQSGIGSAAGPGLGVVASDFNDDGWPDLYIANDGEANHLWINQRNGTFREEALQSGVAFSEDGLPQAGMGIAVADYDGDSHDDILVTNLMREGATLYRSEGRGFFTDVSAQTGLKNLTFGNTGFGVGWFDYDNDGQLELVVGNGAVTVLDSQRSQPRPFRQPIQLLRLRGTRFELDVQFPILDVSRGLAIGDIDNDGDLDAVVTNNSGPVRLLRNDIGTRNHWLRVRPDTPGGISGTRVSAAQGQDRPQWRRIGTDGSYLSTSEPVAHFGVKQDTTPTKVDIVWIDGQRESWLIAGVDRTVELKKGTGKRGPHR